MPWLGVVGRIGKNNQTPCHRSVEVSDGSAEGLPSEDCQPAYISKLASERRLLASRLEVTSKIAQKLLVLRRSEHGDPMILSSRRWCPIDMSTLQDHCFPRDTAAATHIDVASANVRNTESVPIQTKM